MSGRKCEPGCVCKRHQAGSKKCPPGCTCEKHRKMTPEERDRHSRMVKDSWARDDVRRKRSESIRKALSDPDWKARHSEIMTEIGSRPEVKARLTGRPRQGEGHWATQSNEYYSQRSFENRTECDICNLSEFTNSEKRHHVDHNHKTGKIRGILCSRCNGMVGHVEKNRLGEVANEWLSLHNQVVLDYLEAGDEK